jgi:hypothetical protein
MPLAILAFRAQPNAVRERGFEPIKISANDVEVPINNQARTVWAHVATHNAGLALMH